MPSNETILKIYWKRLAKRKRGKKETVLRCPRISYRAAVLTGDFKLAKLFIDTHSSIRRYDDEFRESFDSARREIYDKAHKAHDEKYPREEGNPTWAQEKWLDYKDMEKSIELDTAQKKGELEELLGWKKEHHKRVITPMRRDLIASLKWNDERNERDARFQRHSDDGPRVPPPLLSGEELREFKDKYGLTTRWTEDKSLPLF